MALFRVRDGPISVRVLGFLTVFHSGPRTKQLQWIYLVKAVSLKRGLRIYAYGIVQSAGWAYLSTSQASSGRALWHCSECGMGLSQHESGQFRPRLMALFRVRDGPISARVRPVQASPYGIVQSAGWAYLSTSQASSGLALWHCSECGMGLSQHESGQFRPRLMALFRVRDGPISARVRPVQASPYGIVQSAGWAYLSTSQASSGLALWHCSECGMGLSQHESGQFRPRLMALFRVRDGPISARVRPVQAEPYGIVQSAGYAYLSTSQASSGRALWHCSECGMGLSQYESGQFRPSLMALFRVRDGPISVRVRPVQAEPYGIVQSAGWAYLSTSQASSGLEPKGEA